MYRFILATYMLKDTNWRSRICTIEDYSPVSYSSKRNENDYKLSLSKLLKNVLYADLTPRNLINVIEFCSRNIASF